MNPIELTIDETMLSPDEKALLGLLRELPVATLVQYLRVLHHWDQAPPSQRAIAIKLLDSELSDKQVAQLCGKSERQLRRYAAYRRFSRLLEHERRAETRGYKTADGDLEAWVPEE